MSHYKATHTKRRMPTTEQLRVWRAYIETAEALRARLARRLQDEASLSAGDYEVLLGLSEAASQRLRSSELAARVGWERSRLSHHLGRMEDRGLIRREECPEDRRGAEVVLSEAGAKAFRAGSIPHLMAVRELFLDAFTSEQLVELEGLMGALRGHLGLDDDGAGVPSGG
ncbi:MAG: MarR family transcriptional regulator [Thioalkalivibrio sp.]|nr:MarR family transcriptional regulator [Thioalkalivibrio sp.]